MTRRRWTVSTHHSGQQRDIDVYLYDRLGDMRGAATKHSKAWEPEPAVFDKAFGVCHGFECIRVDADGTEHEEPLAAILRFTRGHTTPEIVSHETAHASQHLYGMDCTTKGDEAREHFTASNEVFAHLAGNLFAAVWPIVTEQP